MQSRWWRFLSYRIRVEVKVQDAWIGFFWDRKADGWHAWLCLLLACRSISGALDQPRAAAVVI